MKVLVAGASGAIGRPLVHRLKSGGHEVFGIVRSADRVVLGAEPVVLDVLDARAVGAEVGRVRPDVIINELTSLPARYTPENMRAAAAQDRALRLGSNENLLAAAEAAGVRRYIVQSSAFWYEPGLGLADETAPFAFEASPGVAAGTRTYAQLESRLFSSKRIEGVAVRYGFLYGPGTWYTKEGDVGERVRRMQIPIVGEGQGVWSFVHIEDAAIVTAAAVHCDPGVYNVVDDEPAAQHAWLPAFARYAGAPDPPRVTEERALEAAGADVVYYATRLRGASNEKAKRALKFIPRPLEWMLRSSHA